MDYIINYINPTLIPIAIVLWCFGVWLKNSSVRNELIPWLLCPIGAGVVALWLCSQGIPTGLGQWLVLMVNSLIQGILCAALAVFGDQLAKQTDKIKNPTISVAEADIEVISEALGVSAKALQGALLAQKKNTSL